VVLPGKIRCHVSWWTNKKGRNQYYAAHLKIDHLVIQMNWYRYSVSDSILNWPGTQHVKIRMKLGQNHVFWSHCKYWAGFVLIMHLLVGRHTRELVKKSHIYQCIVCLGIKQCFLGWFLISMYHLTHKDGQLHHLWLLVQGAQV
jgi:hypothetical protein